VSAGNGRLRSIVLGTSAVVAVLSLAAAALIFFTHTAGDSLGDRLTSLRKDEVPVSGEEAEREDVMSAARTFVLRFNTYGPSMLDSEGHLPDYDAVGDLMTSTFATVFDKNVGYAEQTVKQLGAKRSAVVHAVGVASQDSDSAEVLVAGTVELSYPYPKQLNQQTSDDDTQNGPGNGPRITSGPQRFRYEVSLVKVGGEWLVDDLDDVDDGKPSFAQPDTGQETPGVPTPGAPTGAPPSSGSGKGSGGAG
jgi:hypothetical protein